MKIVRIYIIAISIGGNTFSLKEKDISQNPLHFKIKHVTLHTHKQKKQYTKMKLIKSIFVCLLLLCGLNGCESGTEINENSGQQIYNDIKGTYVGNIVVDNIPQKTNITISNDFSVSPLPLKPILARIFTNEAELAEALESVKSITLTTPITEMSIIDGFVYLFMKDIEWEANITVNGKMHKISATMEPLTQWNMSKKTLTINIVVTDLICNSESYDLEENKITYFVDSATRE